MQPQTTIGHFYMEYEKEGGALLAQYDLYRLGSEKTQDYVRRMLTQLYSRNAITPEMIVHLRDKGYSSRIFGLSYPFLRSVSEGKKDRNGYNRYWKDFIFADKYYVCSQWQLQNTDDYELRLYVWCASLLKNTKPAPASSGEKPSTPPEPAPASSREKPSTPPEPAPASSEEKPSAPPEPAPVSSGQTPPAPSQPVLKSFPEIYVGMYVIDTCKKRVGKIEMLRGSTVRVRFKSWTEHFSYPDVFSAGRLVVVPDELSPSPPAPAAPPVSPSPPSLLPSFPPRPSPLSDKLKGAVLCCPVCGEVLPRTGTKSVLCPGCYREMNLEIKHDGRLVISMLCPDPEILDGKLIRGRGNETEKDGGAARG